MVSLKELDLMTGSSTVVGATDMQPARLPACLPGSEGQH